MAKTLEIGPAEISKAISDAEFYRAMPEFSILNTKMRVMKDNSKKGCTPCKMRRVVNSINADFMHILPTLSDDGKARFKKYYGVDEVKYNKIDRVARKMVTITF